jgi:hypothetical protein
VRESLKQLLGYVVGGVSLLYLCFSGRFDCRDGAGGAAFEHAAPEQKVGRSVVAVDADQSRVIAR